MTFHLEDMRFKQLLEENRRKSRNGFFLRVGSRETQTCRGRRMKIRYRRLKFRKEQKLGDMFRILADRFFDFLEHHYPLKTEL